MQKDKGEGLTLRCSVGLCVGRANNSNTKTSRTCVMPLNFGRITNPHSLLLSNYFYTVLQNDTSFYANPRLTITNNSRCNAFQTLTFQNFYGIANSSCQSSIAIICEPAAQGNAKTIIQDSNNTDFIDSEEKAEFTYNANYERAKMRITSNGSLLKQKYYAGDYELVQTFKIENGIKMAYQTDICYIRTPEGLQAAYKRELPSGQTSIGGMLNSNLVGYMYYFGTDHSGSITSVISEYGEVLERYQYDAWGNRRVSDDISNYYPKMNPTDEDMRYLVLYDPLFDRGYIGEEHLDMFGLINLNARLYDPILGRFLSPDPYIQAPDNLENFNRYTYGWNNPLRYTDPTGLFISFDELGGVDRDLVNGNEFIGVTSMLNGGYTNYGKDFLSGYNANSSAFWDFGGGGSGGGYDGFGGFNDGGGSSYNIYGGSFSIGVSRYDGPVDASGTILLPMPIITYDRSAAELEAWKNKNMAEFSAWLNSLSGLGTGMNHMGGSFRLTNGAYNGNIFSPKYYASNWQGGSRAKITTYSMNKWGSKFSKWGTRGGWVLSGVGVVFGIIDDSQFAGHFTMLGYNTQNAVAQGVGGWAGAVAGAEIGAVIGAAFGGVGAIPGAIIGGVLGGFGGSWFGSYTHNYFYFP
jgi:RHS repeat-associated protein